jgi:site-specific DNA-methyltransferase (cytosine-N4-specific)
MSMTDWLNRIHVGDCMATMRRMIADGVRVQCIVTSPPYWGLRDYGVPGQFGSERTWLRHCARMRSVFRLCRQLLADDGVLWLNYGDSYATGTTTSRKASASADHGYWADENPAMKRVDVRELKPKNLIGMPWRVAFTLQADGWYLRQDVIWSKPNPMPESVRDRCTKAHEYMFLFSKKERYYWDFEAMQEDVSGTANPRRASQKTPDGWDTSTGEGHGSFHKAGREKGHLPGNKTHKGVTAYEAGDEAHRTKGGLVAYLERMRDKALATPRRDGDSWNENAGRGFLPKEMRDPKYADAGDEHRTKANLNANRERKLAAADSGTKNNDSMDEALSELVLTRNKRSVWTVASEPFKEAHFATFPKALIEPCILAASRAGDTIFDPFIGSGTTAEVASDLGRNFIGCELNPAYAALFKSARSQQIGMAV